MGALFDRFDAPAIKGKDVTLGDYYPGFLISNYDEVFYYPGIRLSGEENKQHDYFMFPHYMQGKHSTDDSFSKEISGFYRVIDGCIVTDKFVDNGFYEGYLFKQINGIVKYPSSDRYYAVLVNRRENKALTRAVFGLTYDELTSLLEAYAKVMGTYNEYQTFPRITRSTKNEHFCEITGFWIPKGFPHVAFDERGYNFAHVSLLGFYRHIQLLTNFSEDSIFGRALLKCGLQSQVLKRVFNIGENISYQTKITKESK